MESQKEKERGKNYLGYYLAGLIEGDGYISRTKENRIILGITFNQKDIPLAEKLLNIIGKGNIVKRQSKSIELRFSAVKSLERIIKMINGKFRTPKIDQLHNLIDWMNKNHSKKILKLSLDDSSLNNNSWLTGFIEADGCFYIRYSEKQIICKFNLEQRMIYPKTQETYKYILEKICNLFNVKLGLRTRKKIKNSYYIIKIENQKSIQNLIDYLDNYSLLSSKYLDYIEWKNSYQEIKNKTHLTNEGKIKILKAKKNMNSKRTLFNWEHLKKF